MGGIQKLALVEQAAGLEGEELGAFLRREGVHLAELEQWRKIASEALGAPKRRAPSKELRRIRAELARKDKALAETAALLVLKKSGGDLGGRGRRHQGDERLMLLELIDEAVASGAPLYKACKVVGIAPTTLARWRATPAPRMVVGARTRPHETP